MGSFPTKSCHKLCSSYQAKCQDMSWSQSSRDGIPHCYCIFNKFLLKQISPNVYEYLDNIDMEHWHNMQWIKTQKFPPEAQLPPRYGVVTSNTSECINSMIDDYRSEGWTDLLEGVLQKMAEKISENRQHYRMVDGNDVVTKVKQVLKECFHTAAAMQVVELEVDQKYMVAETYGSTINLNQQQVPQTTETEH